MLFCDIPWLPEKIPVALVSGGTHKLLCLLLGIATFPKGVILIDELENGFYYKALPKVWEALFAFCRKFDVQIFVSTHSKECVDSILPVLKGHEKQFRLLRAERKNGHRAIKTFRGEEFEAAIKQDVEIR